MSMENFAFFIIGWFFGGVIRRFIDHLIIGAYSKEDTKKK